MGSSNVTAVVGLQWGDEGKGRIVDYLASDADFVIRYQGGDNAGHSVVNDKGKFALHSLPSGIFNESTVNIIGAGTVVNLSSLKDEIAKIEETFPLNRKNLIIDSRAHLIMPYHISLDGAEEEARSEGAKIGTTKKGIGPCYTDKAARKGVRAEDLLHKDEMKEKLKSVLEMKNREIAYYGKEKIALSDLYALIDNWSDNFSPFIKDTYPILKEALQGGKKILLEGQLGIMRDNDWGIYPYTTSSNPSVSGAANGSGIAPNKIKSVVGVMKAYSTSVGGGPYPVELFDEDGEKLRNLGHEYGVTTGRSRRCGWFDAVSSSYAVFLNGVTEIALTKLDILDSFEKIKVCTHYIVEGKKTNILPLTEKQEKATPVYKELNGWKEDTTGCRKWEDLPQKAKDYVLFLEDLSGAEIKYISVGPERDQIIIR